MFLKGYIGPKLSYPTTSAGWNRSLLTCYMEPWMIGCQQDPALYLNTRRALLRDPSPALVTTKYGSYKSVDVLNPEQLVESADAIELAAYIKSKFNLAPVVMESRIASIIVEVDWNTETRRFYTLDGLMNVAEVLAQYAQKPGDAADAWLKEQLQLAGYLLPQS